MVNRHELDIFAPKEIQRTKATSVGIFLTMMMPIALGAFMYNSVVTNLALPPIIDTETKASTKVFGTRFVCLAQEGCLMTVNYFASQNCQDAINDSGNAEWQGYLLQCTKLSFGAEKNVPVCYTSDPIDGVSFSWKRDQTCSLIEDASVDSNGECRFGVIIKTEYLSIADDRFKTAEWKATLTPLFFGIHVLSINEVHESLTEESAQSATGELVANQVLPVHSSEESWIDNSNLCCAEMTGICANTISGDPGTVNDHVSTSMAVGLSPYVPGTYYTAKIRTFPSYTEQSYSRRNIVTTAITDVGAIYNIFFIGFGIVAIGYRLIAGGGGYFGSDEESPKRKLKNSAEAD